MDRRTITAVVLSLAIYYTWLTLRGAPPEVIEEPVPQPEPAAATVTPTPTPSDVPVREIPFEACDLRSVISTDGGGLRLGELEHAEGPYEITPIYSWILGLFTGGETTWHPYGEEIPAETVLSKEAHALVAGSGNPATSHRRFEVVSEGKDEVVLRSVGADGIEVEQRLKTAVGQGSCTFDVDVTWTNKGTGSVEPSQLWFGMFDAMAPPGGMFAIYQNTERAFARVDEDLEYGAWSEPEEGKAHEPEPMEGPADWLALADRYHGIFALPADRTGTAAWARYGSDGETPLDGVVWSPPTGLEGGQSLTATFQIYAGSHDTDVLAAIDETLVDIIDFGMFAVFAYPLLFALQWLQAQLGNWGVAIITLTVAVKAVFFPLTQSAFRSGEAMKAIQPKMKELQEKYKDNQEEQQRKTMELFREHGVNPLGGCLPMFIQMPVFLALFYVLMYSADLYHTQFLYLQDLSSPDPYCLLPSVVVGMMLIQQQFTPMGNMDPAQARMMKLMPLMFGVFWFMFPSGLVVYYFFNTGLGILQQWWIRRTFSTVEPTPAA